MRTVIEGQGHKRLVHRDPGHGRLHPRGNLATTRETGLDEWHRLGTAREERRRKAGASAQQ
jgi:hypothetical protein